MERVQSENRLAGSPEQSKIIKHKGRSGGEEVCQHHNVNTAGRDEEEEEEEGGRKTKKKKEKEEEEKGNEKHKHLIKCRSGLDKAGLFFPLFNLQLTTSLSDTCKVNIWNYTWRFHMLISVICASIKICRYNEAISYGYVRTRGKETNIRKTITLFHRTEKEVHIKKVRFLT